MASVNPVKDGIIQLYKLLKYGMVCDHITPEHFRQAMQNKPEAIYPMTQLLSSVFFYISSSLPVEKNTFSHSKVLEDIPVLELLKIYRYPRHHLLLRNSILSSSKELLFAFAWMLHCTKLVSKICGNALHNPDPLKIIRKEKCLIGDKNISNPSSSCISSESLNEKLPSLDNLSNQGYPQHMGRPQEFNSLSPLQQLHYISWSMGRLEILSNRLKSLQICNSNLQAQIVQRACSYGENQNARNEKTFYTVNELLMLKHPFLMQTCEKDLERKIQVLQAFLKWKDLQSVFWKWLDDGLSEANHSDAVDSAMMKIDYFPSVYDTSVALTENISQAKILLFESQKKWLDEVKKDPMKLRKIRLEQEHQAEMQVEQSLSQIRNISGLAALAPNKASVEDYCPVSATTQNIQAKLEKVKQELTKVKEKCNEELTVLAKMKLSDNLIIIQPPKNA